jgi:hypothetical protein
MTDQNASNRPHRYGAALLQGRKFSSQTEEVYTPYPSRYTWTGRLMHLWGRSPSWSPFPAWMEDRNHQPSGAEVNRYCDRDNKSWCLFIHFVREGPSPTNPTPTLHLGYDRIWIGLDLWSLMCVRRKPPSKRRKVVVEWYLQLHLDVPRHRPLRECWMPITVRLWTPCTAKDT